MGRYDEDTQKFIDDVSKPDIKELAAKSALNVAKDVAKGKRLAPSVVKRTLQAGTQEYLSKKGGLTALTVYEWLSTHYHDLWWDWEPETIEKTLVEDFQVRMSEELKNLVHALQVIAKTNAPFEDWHVFEKVGHALNEDPVNFGYIQPMEMDAIAWAVMVLRTIRPQTAFESEVAGYIAACARHSGMVYLPEEYFPPESQVILDKEYNDLALREGVAKSWPNTIQDASALGVQGARLAEIEHYVGGFCD